MRKNKNHFINSILYSLILFILISGIPIIPIMAEYSDVSDLSYEDESYLISEDDANLFAENTNSVAGELYYGGGVTLWYNKGTKRHLNYDGDTLTTETISSPNVTIDSSFKWEFVYDYSNVYFTIRPIQHYNYALKADITEGVDECPVSFVNTFVNTTITDSCLWTITGSASEGYYIRNKANTNYCLYAFSAGGLCVKCSSSWSDYRTWLFGKNEAVFCPTSFDVNYSEYMNKNSTQNVTINNIIPTYTTNTAISDYSYKSSNTEIATINSSGVITAVEEGTTTIFIKHKFTGIIRYFQITVGSPITSGTYYIVNKKTGQYIDLYARDGSNEANLCLNDWENTIYTKWNVTFFNGSGYIMSQNDNMFMGVNGSNNGSLIVQFDSVSNEVYISIRATKSGAFRLYTSSAVGFNGAITYFDVYPNRFLCQKTYTDDDDYADEWLFLDASPDVVFSTETGITSNAYHYITNVNSGRNMALSSTADTSMNNVNTAVKSNSNLQRWKFGSINTTDDTCLIYPEYSPSGKVLDVSGNNVDIYNNNNASYEKFKVYRVNIWPHEGQYIIMYGDKYVSEDSNHNVCITNNLTSSSYWSISTYKTTYNADLFCFNYPGYNSSKKASDFVSTLSGMSYNAQYYLNSTPKKMQDLLNAGNSRIMVYRGHGGPCCLEFHSSDGSVYAYYRTEFHNETNTNDRYAINLTDNSLAGTQLILFLGCSTGLKNRYGESFLDILYDKGADFVLGTYDTTYVGDSDNFMYYFFYYLNLGYSVSDAIKFAQSKTGVVNIPSYGISSTFPVIYKGNDALKIK